MERKSRFSKEKRLECVLRCVEGKDSICHTAKITGISERTLRTWIRNYKSLGVDGLNTTSKNASYSEELKNKAVKDYLDGKGSQDDVCKNYGIRSRSQLINWIIKYNNHEKLKSSKSGGVAIMTKGRKTSFDERVEIVKYYIEQGQNYSETAQKFNVSYQQVYIWTKKYLEQGVESLIDGRGRRKTEDELSETEKLRAKNKLLEAEIRRKQMEIDFLKKLEEIERGRS